MVVMSKKTKSSRRGYRVLPGLLEALEKELTARDIEYKIVDSPESLGEYPRPVWVSRPGEESKGWLYFGRCAKCKDRASTLTAQGDLAWCNECSDAYNAKHERNYLIGIGAGADDWLTLIERGTSCRILGLPDWIKQEGVVSVGDVREQLKRGVLAQVGPERSTLVSAALDKFLDRVLASISRAVERD